MLHRLSRFKHYFWPDFFLVVVVERLHAVECVKGSRALVTPVKATSRMGVGDYKKLHFGNIYNSPADEPRNSHFLLVPKVVT